MMKISNRIVTVDRTPIFFGKEVFEDFDRMVKAMHPGGIFILTDENTGRHCLPLLLEKTRSMENSKVIQTEGGEEAKSLDKAGKLWQELMGLGANRSSLIVNLGGGVISDLGGFVAGGYQRGIRYINMPTSLMGQADAAIGGKTAVNLGHIKNQVGFYYPASGIFVYPGFLETLPAKHLRSGLAEIIKSALIGNEKLWRRIRNMPVDMLMDTPPEEPSWQDLIRWTITFKNKVVVKDFREVKHRKILNFGHTIGHAMESISFSGSRLPLLHGEAVAAGMICEAWLSGRKTGLTKEDLNDITGYLADGFDGVPIDPGVKDQLTNIMKHDKKMKHGQLHFTLISRPGLPVVNIACDTGEIYEAIDFYSTVSR